MSCGITLPDELLKRLTYPFHDVWGGCVGKLTRVRFVLRQGKLDVVEMYGTGNNLRTQRQAIRGLSIRDKDLLAVRELYTLLKKSTSVRVEVIKL